MDTDLDSSRRTSIITLLSAKTLTVGNVFQKGVIFIDVKLNLQETDYGNFLSEEVCFGSGVGDVL